MLSALDLFKFREKSSLVGAVSVEGVVTWKMAPVLLQRLPRGQAPRQLCREWF